MTPVELSDGRSLDVRLSGPDGGPVLLFHHGTPGALTPVRAIERAVHDCGLRLLTYSRPGYGGSSRQPGRDVAAAADDVRQVLAQLRIERCLVAGWSGGGPHALATGALLPDRVAGVLVIAGAGPSGMDDLDFLAGMGEQNVEEFTLARAEPGPFRAYLNAEAEQLRGADPDGIVQGLSTLLPEVDRRLMTDELGKDMVAGFAEALRTGVDGWFDDDLAFIRPWGFPLDLAVPSFVWQGEADLMVPPAHGRWLASRIPGTTAHLEPDEGHLSISIGALDRMLDELVATW